MRYSTAILFVAGTIWAPLGFSQNRIHEITLPAIVAFTNWKDQIQPGANLKAEVVATGITLARARNAEMRSLMERDPAEFLRQALPETERAQLPSGIQPLIEQRIKVRGTFGVYCTGLPGSEPNGSRQEHRRSGYTYEVRAGGKSYQAFVFGKWKDQRTVREATIEGVALGDAIAIGDSPTPSEQSGGGQPASELTPTTGGPNTLLYMIARFSDQGSDPIDDATVLSQMGVVSNFWMNNSSGTVYLHGLIHSTQVVDIVHITLPQPASYGPSYNNNFAQLLSDARTAASAAGYNYANYNLDVVVTSNSGFGYAGRSYIGAQGSHWVQGYTSLRTAGHELGHNLGLYHANYWRTDSTTPFGKDSNPGGYAADVVNGEWVEYGHYFSVMSAQYGGEWDDATKPMYNPAEKAQLGWLSGNAAQYIGASGTYRLFRHDAQTTVGTPRGIRIETPASDYTGYGRRYWLSYRYAPWSVAQSWFQNGVEVDVAQTYYGSDGSILLDMSPYSYDQTGPFYNASSPPGGWWTIDNSDKLDGALVVGRTYDDTSAGIHITPLRTGSNGVGEEYIDVTVNLGSFVGNHPPVINSFSASANEAAANQIVSFNVSATDLDGDSLAYSWDFDQVQTWTSSGLNSPTAAKSWPAAGQYRVVVTVSDMKGGKATASTIVTVGTPANNGEIWGRVIWGGQPVNGALVATTAGNQAWTGSDGTYVLTDLALGNSYTINCAAVGLTFTPQFANPLSLNPSNFYGADFYANQPLSGAAGTTYTISGQVTDPINGTGGIEVRAGGMVTTTDASGNYQFTNLLNGTYMVTARANNWTFSPPSRNVTINGANSTANNFARSAPFSISGTFSGIPAGNQSPAPTVYLSNGERVTATRQGTGANKYWGYTLSGVPTGQYSVGAALSGYSITPSGFSNPLNISGGLAGINFAGASSTATYAITGRVIQQGVPIFGVTVQANQGGLTVASVSTDSDGYFRFDNLTSGSYTIVPSKSGHAFSPASQGATAPSGGVNFNAIGPFAPPVITSLSANPQTVPNSFAPTTLSAVANGTGPLSLSWDAVVAPGPVSFSTNDSFTASATTVTFQTPGSYTFRARVTDTNGLAAISNINVTVSSGPGQMVVTPFQAQLAGGQSMTFRADAWDQLGNRITVTPTWSVNGGGHINSSGLFSGSTQGGPFTIVASTGALSATGFVWVTSSSSTSLMPPTIAIAATNANVALSWNSTVGATYRVQYKNSFSDTGWVSIVPDIVAGGTTTSLTTPATVGQRFYRILAIQ